MTWLAAQGIRLPSQMSIISLAYEPFFDYIFPLVSGYRVHPETVSKQVIRRIEALVAGNPNRRSHSWISPTIVKGASVAELP